MAFHHSPPIPKTVFSFDFLFTLEKSCRQESFANSRLHSPPQLNHLFKYHYIILLRKVKRKVLKLRDLLRTFSQDLQSFQVQLQKVG